MLIKSRNQNIFEKFQLHRNLQTIPFKIIYNMSMLRYRFSNERGGGGGGGGLNHLPLLFSKSVDDDDDDAQFADILLVNYHNQDIRVVSVIFCLCRLSQNC